MYNWLLNSYYKSIYQDFKSHLLQSVIIIDEWRLTDALPSFDAVTYLLQLKT